MFSLRKIIASLMLLMGIAAFGKKARVVTVTAGETLNNVITGKRLNLDKGNGKKIQFVSLNPNGNKNYKTNTAGVMFDYDDKNVKNSSVKFAFGFDILNDDIEIENVKVYVAVPNEGEKLLVEAVMPKEAKKMKDSKKGQYVQEMELKRGSTSRVGDIIVNEYNWMGQSDAVGKADPNLLFSRTSKSYAYLFKFVIKAKGMSEEIIYQPAILKVKLVGAQNF